MADKWTDAETERLPVLVGLSLTFQEIGDVLGRTRRMVAAKCARMGLHGQSGLRGGNRRSADFRRQAQAIKAGELPPPLKIERLPVAVPVLEGADADFAVNMFDVGDNQCRWPQGDPGDRDFKFCGRPGKPYCPAHARQSRNPNAVPRKIREQPRI